MEDFKKIKEQNNDLRKIYRNTYNKLFENGNDELARYFQAQIDDCPTFYVEPIIDYAKEWKDYKSRCEKAVEYIKEHSQMTDLNIHGIENVLSFRGSVDSLLNILNGRSE